MINLGVLTPRQPMIAAYGELDENPNFAYRELFPKNALNKFGQRSEDFTAAESQSYTSALSPETKSDL